MSEKIFNLLLRLYPAAFRKDYRDEARQLLRDRFRDERGFFPRLRLWFDLLADLAVSIPRGYRGRQPALIAASARRHLDGAPSFQMIEGESPRPAAFFFGTAAALIAVAVFSIALGQAGNYRPLRIRGASHSSAHNPKWPASSASAQRSPAADEEGAGAAESATAARQAPTAQGQAHKSPPTAAGSPALDAAERKLVMREIVTNLKQHYVSSKAAQGVADGLLAHEKSGDYDTITDGRTFAFLITHQMRDLSHDPRLSVEYSPIRLPDRLGLPPGATESYRAAMQQENCMIRKAEILPHNIGYLKLDAFPDLSICQSTAAAMASVNNASAIIFDLQENGGGYPEMVSFIAAYLFDHPVYLYNPRETTSERSWTASPVPGSRLADKPVYILTSASTFSGAEEFAYNLKMLKRATLVGETTRGGEHARVWRRIDDRFRMGVPETQPINPYSKSGWEGTGIEPDVKVKATKALKTAENLAKSKLEKK